jgi:hypothetical protein
MNCFKNVYGREVLKWGIHNSFLRTLLKRMFLQGLLLLCFATSALAGGGGGSEQDDTPTHPLFQHLGRSKRRIPWETMSETKEERIRRRRGWLFGNGSQNGNGCNGVVGLVGMVLGILLDLLMG